MGRPGFGSPRWCSGRSRRLAQSEGHPGQFPVLVLDDLQWADQASLSLLHSLVRLAGRERLLILGCYRDTDLDRSHPLSDALDNWNRERAAVRVHLGRLGLDGTSAMVTVRPA